MDNASKLHRRTVIGAVLLFAVVIVPFLLLLAWVNWSIVFRGADWARLDLSNPGMPEIWVAAIAVVTVFILLRTFAKWLFDVAAAHLSAPTDNRHGPN